MAAVTTETLLSIALEMTGASETPPDCSIDFPGTRISHILIGLDVGAAELFMARQLGFHAVIALRPHVVPGEAWRLVEWHEQRLRMLGVQRERNMLGLVAMELQLRAAALAADQDALPSVARLLEMPLVTIGSPLDELARRRIQDVADDLTITEPAPTVGKLRDALLALPEFAAAPVKPWQPLGREDAPIRWLLALPGGLAVPHALTIAAYFQAGKSTLLCPDLPVESFSHLAPRDPTINLLLTGRAATASLGANPYIARLRAEGLEVHPFAGILPTQ
jgi:hypothetical protein